MRERVKFVLEWEKRWHVGEGLVNMSELCREFGISRERGYTWLNRYRDAGHDVRVLEDRSRRPHNMPTKTPQAIEDLVVAERKKHPKWGPRKLSALLKDRYPGKPIPSSSGVGAILKRRGLTMPRKRRRRRVAPLTQPFAGCTAPNEVWCVDFKGWFRTGNGVKCYPLTITDGHSRLVIRCEGVKDPNGYEVTRIFDSAFQEFGLPLAIRSDNGPPFASTGAGGLTQLSVWWLRLGIRLERIEPGKPQQNGRHERMHLTLKNDVCSPPSANMRAQQRAFDLWRKEFNEVRPHEALGMKPPLRAYVPSSRKYPRKLTSPDYYEWSHALIVDQQGRVRLGRHKVFVSTALCGEPVLVEPQSEHTWSAHYGQLLLGTIDSNHLDRGVVPPRRRRQNKKTAKPKPAKKR
jgi:putative transposase